jgi:uncharacterized integral membrane protein (TIGR00697 family)
VSQLYLLVTVLFVACLIAANITATKLIEPWGLVMDAGTIVFPVSYILGDVLTEVYGFRAARRVIWLGFLANLLVVAAIALARPPMTRSWASCRASWRPRSAPISWASSPIPWSWPR